MTDFAEKAVAASLQFEALKTGCKQLQSGDWVFSLKVAGTDTPQELLEASMGQRFVCVIVPIDDHEEPKQKRNWSELKHSAQCAMRLNEPLFRTFMIEEYGLAVTHGAEEMEAFVKRRVGIQSKRELNTKGPAQNEWIDMDERYQAWKLAG